jgi:UDP-glucuronate 4-epimerase
MENILITGVCGFIGYHLARRLLEEGAFVVGIDNLNPYYEVALKEKRLSLLEKNKGFSFVRGDVTDRSLVSGLFEEERFDVVVHLAAQAGVRYSITDPYSYLERNLAGLFPVLEGCRRTVPEHLLFASSSSVYGSDDRVPFSEHNPADRPISLYAATKRSGELLCYSYSYLYGIPITAMRFFTVYGPWGRPDMAYYRFTRLIFEEKPIDVYNYGRMSRDFTYVDDIIEGVVRVIDKVPSADSAGKERRADPATGSGPFRIYNIGRGKPVDLSRFIEVIEKETGKKAVKNLMPMQQGDVARTFADIGDLRADTGFEPKVGIDEGIQLFVRWYREYHGV